MDDDDANFVHNPNVHIGRVHSITDKAMLARQWKDCIEALVDHHQFGGRFWSSGRRLVWLAKLLKPKIGEDMNHKQSL